MVVLVAALLVCLVTVPVYAGYAQAMGEIKSIDAAAGKLVVAVRESRDAEPKDVTYQVDKDATIRINREKKTLADLAVGKRVSIMYKEGEPPVALLITVMEMRRPAGGGGGGGRPGGGGGGGGQ